VDGTGLDWSLQEELCISSVETPPRVLIRVG
jgi:hypothetical protein